MWPKNWRKSKEIIGKVILILEYKNMGVGTVATNFILELKRRKLVGCVDYSCPEIKEGQTLKVVIARKRIPSDVPGIKHRFASYSYPWTFSKNLLDVDYHKTKNSAIPWIKNLFTSFNHPWTFEEDFLYYYHEVKNFVIITT